MSTQWSEDRQWWWDGQRWRPAAEYQQNPPSAAMTAAKDLLDEMRRRGVLLRVREGRLQFSGRPAEQDLARVHEHKAELLQLLQDQPERDDTGRWGLGGVLWVLSIPAIGIFSIAQAFYAPRIFVFVPFVGIIDAGLLVLYGFAKPQAWAIVVGITGAVLSGIGAVLSIYAVIP